MAVKPNEGKPMAVPVTAVRLEGGRKAPALTDGPHGDDGEGSSNCYDSEKPRYSEEEKEK